MLRKLASDFAISDSQILRWFMSFLVKQLGEPSYDRILTYQHSKFVSKCA